MSKRISRQTAIRQIISSGSIESQEELLNKLYEDGHSVTQATLSRDLKSMKVIKVPQGSTYKYVLPDITISQIANANQSGNFFADGFRSIEFSANIAVIKTKPAFASGIASFLDEVDIKEVLGSVAGDDTIIVVLSEDATPEKFKSTLIHAMPTLEGRI
ncbi:MAG: arginine repressor [Mangrovibacterium sp.]